MNRFSSKQHLLYRFFVKTNLTFCQGDSGGPLTYKSGEQHVLIGDVSFGYRCGLPDIYGVYGRVSFYRDWIDGKLSSAKFCGPGPDADAWKQRYLEWIWIKSWMTDQSNNQRSKSSFHDNDILKSTILREGMEGMVYLNNILQTMKNHGLQFSSIWRWTILSCSETVE